MPLSTDAWTPRAAQRPSPSGCDEAAQAAILAREVKPSLVRMCSTWFSAVRCEITSSAAITSPRSTTPPASWPVTAALHTYTGIIGTSVSGTFLYLIAALNAVILHSIIRVFQQMRTGKYSDEELERQLDARGLMNRIFGGNARRIGAPWKMYPVGVLFGLGFDTATEVALLVLAGTAVASGLPFYAVLSLPTLLAAGMCLFDTADGCFMNFACDWAFARPVRKVFDNLTITGLSVFAALFTGTIEILGLTGQEYGLTGAFWTFLGNFNINKAG